MSTKATAPSYAPGGTCWQNAGDAAACTEVCANALEALVLGPGKSTPACQ